MRLEQLPRRAATCGLLLVAIMLGACARDEEPAVEAEPAQAEEAYAAPVVKSGDPGITSIDASGNVAPFGMASRQPVPVPDAPSAMPVAAAEPVAAAAGVGADTFATQCVACHGADGRGVQGLGGNLVESGFVAAMSVDEFAAFLQTGRPADAPDNESGIPMPAFAWMEDSVRRDVAAYVKNLQ